MLQYLVVPDFDETVVSSRHQVRLVTAMVVIHAVDALLVTFQREVRRTRTKIPDLQQSTWRDERIHRQHIQPSHLTEDFTMILLYVL